MKGLGVQANRVHHGSHGFQFICPCGCRGFVKPGNTFATRACWHRFLTPEMRRSYSRNMGRPPGPVVMVPCRAGCGKTFRRRGGIRAKQEYCSTKCAVPHRATRADLVAWHKARNAKAVAGRIRANYREARRRAARFKTPEAAWAGGYETGYNRAYNYWQRKFERSRIQPPASLVGTPRAAAGACA